MTGESLARLLGIEGWKMKGEPLFVEGSGRPYAMVEIVRQKKEYHCPCGRRFTSYYDGEEREVRDLSLRRSSGRLPDPRHPAGDLPGHLVKTVIICWFSPISGIASTGTGSVGNFSPSNPSRKA